jgi:hypothetical protein
MIDLLTAAVLIASYNCEVQAPKALGEQDGSVSLSEIGLPPELQQWKFTLSLHQENIVQADIKWPGNPIQAEGKFPAISTAPGAYAFLSMSRGPCLFTETGCTSQFNLADNGKGPADLLITSAALWSDKQANVRTPFVAVIRGKCTRTDSVK